MYIEFKDRLHNPADFHKTDMMRTLKYDNLVLTNEQIEFFFDCIWRIIKEALIEGKRVKLQKFGTFYLKKILEQKRYIMHGDKAGESELYPEFITFRFKLSPFLREELANMQPQLQAAYQLFQKNKKEYQGKKRIRNAKSTNKSS